MVVKFRTAKLLIAALLIVHCGSWSDEDEISQRIMEFEEKLKERAMLHKPGRCFITSNCNGTITTRKIAGSVVVRWHYDALINACSNVYMVPGDGKVLCDEAANLPLTKQECEDLCGERCIVRHPNRKTEPGICMENCHIPVPRRFPQTCGLRYDIRCCPKNYVYPSTTPVPTTTKQPVT